MHNSSFYQESLVFHGDGIEGNDEPGEQQETSPISSIAITDFTTESEVEQEEPPLQQREGIIVQACDGAMPIMRKESRGIMLSRLGGGRGLEFADEEELNQEPWMPKVGPV